MNRDQLYLLKQNFLDNGKGPFCPVCAEMAGLPEFYAVLKPHLNIDDVDFVHDRIRLQ